MFRPAKLRQKKYVESRWIFRPAKLRRKNTWKVVEIWSSTYQRNIDVESTWIRRGVPVGKNASNIGKLHFLPKFHKKLSNVLGRAVIFNFKTPTKKASEFLDYHLKPAMQSSCSYIKDSGEFIEIDETISK